MAFDSKKLNNIAGSMGNMNVWLYNSDDDRATIVTEEYFNEACESYSMRNEDMIFIAASDHRVLGQVYWDGTNASIAALSAI